MEQGERRRIRFQLRRGISIRHEPDANIIRVGVHPPAAILIHNAPAYLPLLLRYWCEPLTIGEVTARLDHADPNELSDAIDDLMSLGLVTPATITGRFDRHELYFQFFGLEREKYELTLTSKRVGIVGTGGIGSTAAMLLAGAGIGHLTISDGDQVELSNLTRSILFEEGDVGKLKVIAAQAHLGNRNSKLQVRQVPAGIDSAEFITTHFSDCDILLLSADRPVHVHEWADIGARRLGIPYLTAGYVELYGSLGPLVIPGQTACYACACLNGDEPERNLQELNQAHQAPSYGPLNAIVSAFAANEIIRYCLGLPVTSSGRQLLVDSVTYELHSKVTKPNPACECGGWSYAKALGPHATTANSADGFAEIATDYGINRKTRSLNALLLDDLMIELLDDASCLDVLDLGCATGVITLALARLGHTVTAVDNSRSMLKILQSQITPDVAARVIVLHEDVDNLELHQPFDRILLNLLIDHIASPAPLLRRLARQLKPSGKLVVVVPHPFKDSGHWEKTRRGETWSFDRFVISNYFHEGPITKQREDSLGNVTIPEVRSYKRNLSTYFRMLNDAGLAVDEILEPGVAPNILGQNANVSKASRVPYFLVFVCTSRNRKG